MLVVFIFLGIITIILLLFILLVFSTVRIEVRKFKADNYVKKEKIVKEYIFFIHLYLFNKIKWFSLKIDAKRSAKFKSGTLLKMIDKKLGIRRGEEIKKIERWIIQNRKDIFNRKRLKDLRDLKLFISKINLDLGIGTENVIVTAFTTAFISSAISILLGQNVKKSNVKNCHYIITPLYLNKNVFKVDAHCIIEVKMVHIMSLMYVLIKKQPRALHEVTV